MEWKLNNGWNMSKIAVNNVSKIFESKGTTFKSVEDINFNVNEEEFLCILGPSGCGKSTILRLIAGLDKPSSGQILMDNEAIIGPGCKCGMVFQEYSLFPWRSVIENVAFPLEMRGGCRRRKVQNC
jgi:NitT/TauT family transport system ATP-binding protein